MTIDLAGVLRGAGLVVHETDGWRTRGAEPVAFEGVMAHHTAIRKGSPYRPERIARGMIVGRADLAGPLCNTYLDRLGEWWMIAARAANHAGKGNRSVLENLRRGVYPAGDAGALGLPDDLSGANPLYVGIEVDNDGVGEPYPPVQLRSLVTGCAALHRAGLYLPIHHREHTKRKIDMSYRGDLRAMVRAQLSGDDDVAGFYIADHPDGATKIVVPEDFSRGSVIGAAADVKTLEALATYRGRVKLSAKTLAALSR